jgi:hypothetical protein
MHGVIFVELRKYVDTKLGRDVWDDLLKEAGLGGGYIWPSRVTRTRKR